MATKKKTTTKKIATKKAPAKKKETGLTAKEVEAVISKKMDEIGLTAKKVEDRLASVEKLSQMNNQLIDKKTPSATIAPAPFNINELKERLETRIQNKLVIGGVRIVLVEKDKRMIQAISSATVEILFELLGGSHV